MYTYTYSLTYNRSHSTRVFRWDFSQIQIPSHLTGGAGGGGAGGGGAGPSGAPRRSEEDPAWIRDMLRENPDQLAILKQNNPR